MPSLTFRAIYRWLDQSTDPPTPRVENKDIKAFRFKDYSSGTLTAFSVQSLTEVTRNGYGKITATNVVMKEDNPQSIIFEAPDLVYVDDAWVLDSSGNNLSKGGYLGTETVTFTVRNRRTGGSESVNMRLLCVHHANYNGGIRIKNLPESQGQILVNDYGDILHPTPADPDGGDNGKVGSWVNGRRRMFCINRRNRPSWQYELGLYNGYYDQYGRGDRNNNMMLRPDGEYTCAVVASLRGKGVLTTQNNPFSFTLDMHGGLQP